MSTRDIILVFLFDYCVIEVVNIALGNPLCRFARWFVGVPQDKPCYKPEAYTEGNWR